MNLESWSNYKKIIEFKMPVLAESLCSGASDEEIREAEEKMNVTFPEQLRALYRENNGDDYMQICGMIMGFHFYSLRNMMSEWQIWKQIYDEDYINNRETYDMRAESSPEKCIKKQYINPGWIPLCGDDCGNHIGIDLDPDVNGKTGQIINFGRDEDRKFVIADDLNSFFERLTRIAESDHFNIDEYEGENVIILSLPDYPEIFFTDYLRSEDSVK